MSDEALRKLRREAGETGDPKAILAYVDAALRTVGVKNPEGESDFLSLRGSGWSPTAPYGEARIRFDNGYRALMVSIDGGAWVRLRTADDVPYIDPVDLPRFAEDGSVPVGSLVTAVDRISNLLVRLGYARRPQ